MAFLDQIEDVLADRSVQNINISWRDTHTRAVEAEIGTRGLDKILGTTPQDFDEEELELSRGERTTLVQISQGFCSGPNSFLNRIGTSYSSLCPCYRQEEHTSLYILQFTEHTTELTPLTYDIVQREQRSICGLGHISLQGCNGRGHLWRLSHLNRGEERLKRRRK